MAVLQVFVDQQAKEEETLEQMREAMDDVVDAGHGVNNGEDLTLTVILIPRHSSCRSCICIAAEAIVLIVLEV